jgi:hypothetical protein
MPFDVRKPYRALNGAELKEVIVARLKTAMDLDATVNLTRSFPLVRYRVTVEFTPFIRTGISAADVKPEHQSVYEVEGEAFLPVQEEAIELVEESPIYGEVLDVADACAFNSFTGSTPMIMHFNGSVPGMRRWWDACVYTPWPRTPGLKPE